MRAVLVTIALIAACPPASTPGAPVALSLQLATRQSCGALSGFDYDTTCLGAIDVRALDAATHTVITEQCRPLAESPVDLRALLQADPPLLSLTKLNTSEVVIFQVYGVHDVATAPDGGPAAGDLCAHVATDNSDWLFWGESDPVDLTAFDRRDGGSPLIRIVIDCRDCSYTCGTSQCFGCGGFGATCPAAFPDSFCVPAGTCDKLCETPDDCFGGARACVDGHCDTTTPDGLFCSPCSANQCAEGLVCVQRSTQASFCAPTCPDTTCATGTKCNRVGNDLAVVP